jgi:DNA (cytosine-5)-methyltransferase 1
MKILNLYAGVGGNRELWGNEHEITAVEFDPKIAKKYQERFQNDTVIVADAHEYLLDHHQEFDFIWTSPPCQTHSRANYFINNGVAKRPRYPNMGLYQEIIFLQQFAKCKFAVENVISYYEPLITPQKLGRHYIWSNFYISDIDLPKNEIGSMDKGWNTACKIPLEERNKANAKLGLHILNCALPKKQKTVQTESFACRQLSFA